MGSSSSDRGRRRVVSGTPPPIFGAYHELRLRVSRGCCRASENLLRFVGWQTRTSARSAAQPSRLPSHARPQLTPLAARATADTSMLRAFVLGIYFIGCIVLGVAVSSASAGTEPMRTRSWKDAGSWEDERSEGEVRYDMNGRVVMTWQSRRRRTGAGAMLEALDKRVSVLLIAVGAEADT